MIPIFLLFLTTFIIVLLKYKKHKSKFYNFFLLYIGSIVVVETIALTYSHYKKPTIQVYNIYTFFEYNLVALIYYNLTKEKFSHRWILSLMSIFNLGYFLSFVFKELTNFSVIIGAVTVSLFMMFYLKELLKSDKIIYFQKFLPFWVTLGLLLYYLTTIPFYSALYIIGIESRNNASSLFLVQNIIVVLTHLCFINGLLWSTKEEM